MMHSLWADLKPPTIRQRLERIKKTGIIMKSISIEVDLEYAQYLWRKGYSNREIIEFLLNTSVTEEEFQCVSYT